MRTATQKTLYHVAGKDYKAGQDLLCWDEALAAGILVESDWHWDEVDVGYDGHMISTVATLVEAMEHRDLHCDASQSILAISWDDDKAARVGLTLAKNSEGYAVIVGQGGVPAEWIETI
jgi:hypothetical protein